MKKLFSLFLIMWEKVEIVCVQEMPENKQNESINRHILKSQLSRSLNRS